MHRKKHPRPLTNQSTQLDKTTPRQLLPLLRRPQRTIHTASLRRQDTGSMERTYPGQPPNRRQPLPLKPPEVNEKILEQIKTRAQNNGIDLSKLPHDLLTELTTPHIASPDVHVDHENKRIVMYFHGLDDFARQASRVALSEDGVSFQALPEIIGRTYMRVFQHHGYTYAMAMPGQFYRSEDGLTNFEEGPLLFNSNMRHSALLVRGSSLYVFWTQVGDTPERILLSTIDVSGDWMGWT